MSTSKGIVKDSVLFGPRKAPELFELEFERLVLHHLPTIMPGWHVVPFKAPVHSDFHDSSARPDLALIHSKFKNWYVIEVELSVHSLSHHVIPQILTLKDGVYGEKHAEYLLSANSELFEENARLLTALIRDVQPDVYVVAERSDQDWRARIEHEGCHYFVLEPHIAPNGQWCYRYDGPLPGAERVLLTHCTTATQFPLVNCLQLEKRDVLGQAGDQQIHLRFEGASYYWRMFVTESTALIMPRTPFPIDLPGWRWAIYRSDGQLELVQLSRRPKGGV